jgi:hypothetical protein
MEELLAHSEFGMSHLQAHMRARTSCTSGTAAGTAKKLHRTGARKPQKAMQSD